MSGLKRSYDDLKQFLKQKSEAPISSLRLEDDTVTFQLQRSGQASEISVVYTDSGSYPHSGAFICDNTGGNTLDALTEAFQDTAPLSTVVKKVCLAYGLETSFLEGLSSPGTTDKTTVEESEMDEDDAAAENSQGSDGGYGSDMEADQGEPDDEDDLEIEVKRREGRWKRHEEALEAAEAAAAAAMSAGASKTAAAAGSKLRGDLTQQLQIFDPAEVFSMLCRELTNMFRMQSAEMFADSIGDDVYRWRVEIFGFSPDSPLGKDMAELSRRYACSSVMLNLTFKRGLYPFCPPAVEVVRPHLQAPLIGAVASHPRLRVNNWTPFVPMAQVLLEIKAFLEAHARVDLSHPRNDINQFSDSAYSPLETQMARLEALTQVPPLCTERYRDIYAARDSYVQSDVSLRDLKRVRKEKEPKTSKGWAPGTGYGHSSQDKSEVWDAAAAQAVQRAIDKEMQALMTSIAASLHAELGTAPAPGTAPGSGTTPPPERMAVDEQPSPSPSTSATTQPQLPEPEASTSAFPPDDSGTCPAAAPSDADTAVSTSDSQAETVAVVCDGCLAPFLAQQFAVASFTDMTARAPYYMSLLQVVQELHRREFLGALACAAGGSCCLAESVLRLQTAARNYLRAVEQQEEQAAPAQTASTSAAASAAAAQQAQQEAEARQLAELLLANCRALDALGLPQVLAAATTSSSGALTAASSDYCTAMRKHQLEQIQDFPSKHKYQSTAQGESVHPRERVLRLAREVAGLADNLPLNESSCILVRVLDSNISLWQALITGPEDTPYAGGCFIFDFYFPANYPKVPPQVNLRTTGGGTIRFNPNLYACGKVCLSLLGTWQGNRGEQWNPDVSTALQVLISIQSLILVPDPYFNEPGYEQTIGTEQGTRASRDYNKVIQIGTIGRAMVDQLQKPPVEFADAIRTHFRLRGAWILANTQKWIDDAATYDQAHAQQLRRLRNQLLPLINAL